MRGTAVAALLLVLGCGGTDAVRQPERAALTETQIRALWNTGQAKETKRDYDGAIADYSQGLSAGPGLTPYLAVNLHYRRGNAHWGKGDLDAALADFSEMIRIDPTYKVAYVNRAKLLQKKGDLDGALANYEKALATNPPEIDRAFARGLDVDAHRGLAEIRRSRGDAAGAKADEQSAAKAELAVAITVSSFRFYEGPEDADFRNPAYAQSFLPAARYVHARIETTLKAGVDPASVKAVCKAFRPDGTQMAIMPVLFSGPGSVSQIYRFGDTPGAWTPGRYAVRVFSDGVQVGEGAFEIARPLLTVRSIAFSEGPGGDQVVRAEKGSRFRRDKTRTIVTDVQVARLFPGRGGELASNLTFKVLGPDGAVFSQTKHDYTLPADANDYSVWFRTGFEKPGSWPAGMYTVEVWLQGLSLLGSEKFLITDDFPGATARYHRMEFYEGDGTSHPDKAVMTSSFSALRTRYVYAVLHLENLKHDVEDTRVRTRFKCVRADGTWSRDLSVDLADIPKAWSTFRRWEGTEGPVAGFWEPGAYRVEAWLEGVGKLGEASFTIVEDRPEELRKAMTLVKSAEAKEKAKDYAGALRDLTQAVDAAPKSPLPYYFRADVHKTLRQDREALKDYSQAIDLGMKEPDAYFYRGWLRAMVGDLKAAVADMDEALRLKPNAFRLCWRGRVKEWSGDLDGAVADFEKALETNPQEGLAYAGRGFVHEARNSLDKALRDWKKAMELGPEAVPDHYVAVGSDFFKRKLYDRAIEAYTRALKLNPKSATAYRERGLAWGRKGDWDLAVADCTKGLEINPELAVLRYNRADFRLSKGDLDGALEDVNACVGLDPANTDNLDLRRQIRMARGEFDAAIEDCNAMLRRLPGAYGVYYSRGLARRAKGDSAGHAADLQTGVDAALKRIREADESGRKDLMSSLPYYVNALAEAREAGGDLDGAIAALDAAVEAAPKEPKLFSSRAVFRFLKGDVEGARADHDEAIRLEPVIALWHVGRGRLYHARGDAAAAEKNYAEAIARWAQSGEAYAARGDLQFDLGSPSEALAAYAKALELWAAHAAPRLRTWVLRARQSGKDAAARELRAYLQTLKPERTPPIERHIADYLVGDLSEADLEARARDNRERMAVGFYAACKRGIDGDDAGMRARLEACLKLPGGRTCAEYWSAFYLARQAPPPPPKPAPAVDPEFKAKVIQLLKECFPLRKKMAEAKDAAERDAARAELAKKEEEGRALCKPVFGDDKEAERRFLDEIVKEHFPEQFNARGVAVARVNLKQLRTSIARYMLDMGRPPTTEEGLKALLPDYLDLKETPKDPWGNAYIYRAPVPDAPDGYVLKCAGPDGKEGTADDLEP